jgi:hypothetical protein
LQLARPRLLFPRDRDPPRDRHLELICDVERVGVVEGVGFDLRHPKLDQIEWGAESLGRAERDRRRYPGRPFLWFPWYGPYSAEFQKREASGSPGWRRFSDAKKGVIELEFTPEKEVRVGEMVSLSQSELIDPADYKMIDVLQDDSVRLATLQIKKADGTVEIVGTPLRFFPRSSSWLSNDDPMAIVNRIDTIVKAKKGDNINRLATEAREILSMINYGVRLIFDSASRRSVRESGQHLADLELARLVNMSIHLGRLLERADAATAIENYARSKQGAKRGGVNSGDTRRMRPWRAIAKDMILKIRQEHPQYSASDIASDVSAGWKVRKPRAPSHETLQKYVYELKRAGEIL